MSKPGALGSDWPSCAIAAQCTAQGKSPTGGSTTLGMKCSGGFSTAGGGVCGRQKTIASTAATRMPIAVKRSKPRITRPLSSCAISIILFHTQQGAAARVVGQLQQRRLGLLAIPEVERHGDELAQKLVLR